MYIVGKQVVVTQIARTRRRAQLFRFPGLVEGTWWWILETVPICRSSLLGFFTVDPEPAAGLLHGGRAGLVAGEGLELRRLEEKK